MPDSHNILFEPALERIAYITLDDGPCEYTCGILDIMDDLDITATFFVLEPQMHKYRNLIVRMAERGHAFGLHGVSHDKKIYKSPRIFIEEMNICNRTLEELTGSSSRLVRAPYGSHPNMSAKFKASVRKKGYILWDWNVDSNDWWLSAEECISLTKIQVFTLQTMGLDPVILFHDRTSFLKDVINNIVAFLQYHNYSIKPLTTDLQPVCHGE